VKSAKNAEIMKKNITSLKWENMCPDENGSYECSFGRTIPVV